MKTTIRSALFSLITCFVLAVPAHATIHTEAVEYTSGGTVCEGFLAYDDAVKAPRPGVMIVHQWKGLTAYEKKRAEMIAGLGYVAFCADIYGKGVRPTDTKAAAALAGKYKGDRALYRERLTSALDVLKKNPRVNPAAVAAMGYCFGGTGALELVRSGAPILGVVSFHGGLNTPVPARDKAFPGRVLVLHGADDPFVPPAEVEAFKKEMSTAGIRHEFVAYPGAVHSFTHWDAGSDAASGAAYNKAADEKSWEAMREFFAVLFPK